MKLQSGLENSDWGAVFFIALAQALSAWMMAMMDLVYAPIPMFVAAIVAGFYFRGRPRIASLAGAVAGLTGGMLAEWAFHVVRVQNRIMNWAQLDNYEQLGLAFAELILYTSLLSFFSAFFSWGTAKEPSAEPVVKSSGDNRDEDGNRHVDIPLFKPEDDEHKLS